MTYLRSLFFNFLVVFFIDRVMPGLKIAYFEQVPDISADIFFAVIVGFFNASVFPFLALMEIEVTKLKLLVMTGIISLTAFGVISFIPFGVQVVSPIGFFMGGGIVWLAAYISNYLEVLHSNPRT